MSKSSYFKLRSQLDATLAIATLSVAFSLIGCSNNDTVTSHFGNDTSNAGALSYFPIEVGYSASFVVTNQGGAEIRRESYTADSALLAYGHEGVSWVQRNLADSSIISIGVMHWNSDKSVLYHTADSSQDAERLLRTPFELQANWSRWHDPSAPGNGGITIDFGNDQTGDNNTGLGLDTSTTANGANSDVDKDNPFGIVDNSNPQLSSFPTQGMPTFYVASINDELTLNGKTYSNCLQIVNSNSNQTVNRYWYAQEVGLVKYALNCNSGNTSGTENGTIIN